MEGRSNDLQLSSGTLGLVTRDAAATYLAPGGFDGWRWTTIPGGRNDRHMSPDNSSSDSSTPDIQTPSRLDYLPRSVADAVVGRVTSVVSGQRAASAADLAKTDLQI